MPISSSEYARRPVLPRPISIWVTRTVCQQSAGWAAVVRGLRHHLHMMRVALDEASAGDLDEPGLLQIGDRPGAAIPHGRPQAAVKLADHGGYRPPVRDPALDALRHELVLTQHVVLEVPVLGVAQAALSIAHRAERAHATVELVLLAADDHHLTRRFLAACQQAAEHHGVGARGDGLGDVT